MQVRCDKHDVTNIWVRCDKCRLVRLDKHDVTNSFGLDVTNTQIRHDKSDLLLGTGGTN